MGSSTLLDILGATVIGGLLFLILLKLNDANVENTYTNGSELVVQQNLTAVVQLIEYDFRKIGYCADYSVNFDSSLSAIIYADSNRIKFFTDIAQSQAQQRGDGTLDTLEYYLDTTDVTETPNPKDRMLYRIINGETPKGSNMGLTMFHLRYYDYQNARIQTPVAVPGQIKTIRIDIQVEDPYGYKDVYEEDTDVYSTIFWRQIRLVARNLTKR